MANSFKLLTLLFITALIISSCSSENECDNACQRDQVQLLDCSCVADANSIIPHPCPDLECPEGTDAVIMNGSCTCELLAGNADPCMNVTCPDGFFCNGGECLADPNTIQEVDVEGEITSDVTWTTNNIYILNSRITVTSGVTLTIEAGTVIKGQAGTGANASSLLVARGGKINALGTADAPIIMTSIADQIQPGQVVSPNLAPDVTGLWGGLIILGNAPISASSEAVQIEGIPTSDSNGLYGGTDAMDNSGTIQYVSVRHGGTNIGEGNEINGITFGGVGAGTVVENVEVLGTQDDGLEFFGGNVSVTNAIVWNNGDDAFDTDQAWAGTLDNAVTVNPGDSPLELDGPEGDYMAGGHTITNLTSYGTASGKELFDVDATTDINMSNLYFTGFAMDAKVSSDYPEYAANMNGFSVMNIQATFLNGGDAASVFGAAAELVTTVDAGANTVGADITAFGWTGASQSGALASIGLE